MIYSAYKVESWHTLLLGTYHFYLQRRGDSSTLGDLDFYLSSEVGSAKFYPKVREGFYFGNSFARNSLRMPKYVFFWLHSLKNVMNNNTFLSFADKIP